jgi:hypothetical protein
MYDKKERAWRYLIWKTQNEALEAVERLEQEKKRKALEKINPQQEIDE